MTKKPSDTIETAKEAVTAPPAASKAVTPADRRNYLRRLAGWPVKE